MRYEEAFGENGFPEAGVESDGGATQMTNVERERYYTDVFNLPLL